MTVGLVLQGALTRTVADRTVEWVVDEQELEHPFLRVDGLLVDGVDAHVLGDRGRARREQLALSFDLHETHATYRNRLHAGVVAEARDEDPHLFGDVDQQTALLGLDLLPVHGELDALGSLPVAVAHGLSISSVAIPADG
jgi:hypothetical protein